MKMEALKNIPARAISRLQARSFTSRRQQKGAAALEYIVLAAALVTILGALASGDLRDEITKAFEGIFEKVGSAGSDTSKP